MALILRLTGNTVKAVGRTVKIENYIDRVTRFQPKGFEHSEKFEEGTWDGWIHLYDARTGTFPYGLINDVIDMLCAEEVDFTIDDQRSFRAFDPLPAIRSPSLRDYQVEAMVKAIEVKRGVICLPTGSGKTRTAIAIIARLRLPALFFVHKKELLYQTKDTLEKEFKTKIGQVGDGETDIQPITVAMVQTASRLPQELFRDYGVAIFDECLHKNSMILLPDNRIVPIKDIVENKQITHVMSFNPETASIEPKRILRRFKTPMPPEDRWSRIEVNQNDKHSRLLLTGNHKVWTTTGWKPAKSLTTLDTIKWVITNPKRAYPCPLCDTLFESHSAMGGHIQCCHLHREKNNIRLKHMNEQQTPEMRVKGFKKAMRARSLNLKYRKHLSERMRGDHNPMRRCPGAKEKMRASMHKVWSDPEKLNERLRNFMNAPLRGRQHRDRRPTILEQKIMNMNIPDLRYTGNGTFWVRFNGRYKNPDFKVAHQHKVVEVGDTQYWHDSEEIKRVKTGYASIGWDCLYLTDKNMQNIEESKARILKFACNHDVPIARVRIACGRPKGRAYRYNLEVEDNHNYFANGILVSNCHHAPADTVFDIAKELHCEYVIGLSATPRREDGKEMLIWAATGPICKNVSTSELIERKFLAKPYIDYIEVKPIPIGYHTKYQDIYKKAIVNNDERNGKIALKAVELAALGKTYVHVKQILHGKTLVSLINDALPDGYPKAVFIYGQDTTKTRQRVIDSFRRKDLRIMVSTLLGEGMDLPEMYALILAGGGLSRTYVQQVFGRVLRGSVHKVVEFWDCNDPVRILYSHFLERVRFYKSEPAFVLSPKLEKIEVPPEKEE